MNKRHGEHLFHVRRVCAVGGCPLVQMKSLREYNVTGGCHSVGGEVVQKWGGRKALIVGEGRYTLCIVQRR